MTWGEAYRLTEVLLADPSSALTAAVFEWRAPVSREWMVLADLADILAGANWQRGSGKEQDRPKPYPRPFPLAGQRGRTTRARAEVVAILNAHGHEIGG